MALAFPLSLADFWDGLNVRNGRPVLVDQQEYSGLGTGEGLAADLGPRLWQMTVQSAPQSMDDVIALRAKLDALDGAINTLYATDKLREYPKADPDGSILGASTPTIHTIDANRKEMRITGLPAGYVLTAGDMLSVDYGTPSRRAWVRLVTGATASGAGLTPLFEVRPHLRPGITTTLAVTLGKSAMKCKIVPGSLTPEDNLMVTGTLALTLRQTLAAG